MEQSLYRQYPNYFWRKPRCRRSRGYYDHSGALKDMVQNHILQVVALLAMEPPVAFSEKKSVQKRSKH